MLWLILGLICALSYGLYHIANKKFLRDADPLYFCFDMFLIASILMLPFVFILWDKLYLGGISLLFMILLSISIAIANPLYFVAIKLSPVSKTTPLLTITPLFTLILAMITLKEIPSMIGIIGVILLMIGTYFINYSKDHHKNLLEPFLIIFKNRGSMLMLSVAIIYGIGSVLDKHFINASNVISRIVLHFYFTIPMIGAYLWYKDGTSMIQKTKDTFKCSWKPILVSTIIFLSVIITQVWGMSLTYTAYIISLKRTSAVFTVIMAYFIFKEQKDFWYVLFGTILMVLGVVMMVV